jgi:2-dehydropantoate 2-reductase
LKILIYGAGVIGSLYAVLFSKNKNTDVSVYTRGKRLEELCENGLRYCDKDTVKVANVRIIDTVKDDDIYDYIFLTVRENQLYKALEELRVNISQNIVTMVNSLDDYKKWEDICGKGRIIPAFPGAGGSIDDGILNAGLTPALIQPTTFGEISERNTKRTSELSRLFHNSHIPYQIVSDMHLWQLCHLAMVVPIADAYYESEDPEKAGADRRLMSKTAGKIKRNMKWLKNHEGKLSPKKFYMFTLVPKRLIAVGLTITFKSEFGDRFMYRHSMKAPDEMRELHRKFYGYIKDRSKKA